MMNYILANGGKKYKVVQTLGAGLKFDNYRRLSHGFFDEKKGSGDRKTVACIVTKKSSGFMVRLAPFLWECGVSEVVVDNDEKQPRWLALTKNGSDPRYLETVKRILNMQMAEELQYALHFALSSLKWSLNLEVVSKCIDSVMVDGIMKYGEVCAHGSVPKTDHAIIHGGSKSDGSPITPVDLLMLMATVRAMLVVLFADKGGRGSGADILTKEGGEILEEEEEEAKLRVELVMGGFFIAGCFGFDTDERGVKPLIDAFDFVNGNLMCPVIRSVAPCGELDELPSTAPIVAHGNEYHYLYNWLRAKLSGAGYASWHHDGNNNTVFVDNATVFEGFVVHEVPQSAFVSSSSWELLNTCRSAVTGLFDPSMVQADEAVLCSFLARPLAGAATTIIGMATRFSMVPTPEKLTLVDFLHCTTGNLKKFIWHLFDFVESPWGRAHNASKDKTFKPVLATSADLPKGFAVLTISVQGDDSLFYAYEDYLVENPQLLSFSRGFSLIISLNNDDGEDCSKSSVLCNSYAQCATRFKLKYSNYTFRTMEARDAMVAVCCASASSSLMLLDTEGGSGACGGKKKSDAVNIKVLFEGAERYAARWGVYGEASRQELFKFQYLLVAYITSYRCLPIEKKHKTYLAAIDAMMDNLHLAGHAEMAETFLAQLMAASSAATTDKISKEITQMLLAIEPRQVFALAVYALEKPDSKLLLMLANVIAVGFSEPCGGGGAVVIEGCSKGFLFKELKNNGAAAALKELLLPLLGLIKDYGLVWLKKVSKSPPMLRLVMVAATPGAGKSTWLASLKARIESLDSGTTTTTRCIIVASDAIPRNVSNRNGFLMQQIEGAAAAMSEMDLANTIFLIDRCCIDMCRSGCGFLQAMRGLSLKYKLCVHYCIPSHGDVSLRGNEEDWVFPFSESQMYVNAVSVLVRGGHAAGVEGAKGVAVAMEHVRSARLPTKYGLPILVRKALEGIAYKLDISFFQYVRDDDVTAIPIEIGVAMRLALGLELSMEAHQAVCVSAEKKQKDGGAAVLLKNATTKLETSGGVEEGVCALVVKQEDNRIVSRWMVFKMLVDGLCARYGDYADPCGESCYDLLIDLKRKIASAVVSSKSQGDAEVESVWNEWLSSLKDSWAVKAFLARARFPVEEVVDQIMSGLKQTSAAVVVCSGGKSEIGILTDVPLIPSYYALVSREFGAFDWKGYCDYDMCDGEKDVYHVRSDGHSLHVTMCVPQFRIKDFLGSSGNLMVRYIGEAILGRGYNVELKSVCVSDISKVAMVSVFENTGVVVVAPGTDGALHHHITLLCAGSNKDSVGYAASVCGAAASGAKKGARMGARFVAKFPIPPLMARW